MLATALLCQVLLFSAGSCPSCSVAYRELSQHFTQVQVVDVHRERSLAKAYVVFGTPMVVFLKHGKEIARLFGVPSEESLREVKKLCVKDLQG